MADFNRLLQAPAGQAKRPPILPPGNYPGIVKSWEPGDQNANKTAYVRFHCGLVGWGEGVPTEWDVADAKGNVVTVTQADVDLSKRQMRRDFYLTEDAQWRLDDFIASCGIEANGRPYSEVLPELIGKSITVEVQQYLNKNTNELGNQIGKLTGQD